MNKSPIVLILVVSLVVSLGCAKSDWIQSTLVTVDVDRNVAESWWGSAEARPSSNGVKGDGDHRHADCGRL